MQMDVRKRKAVAPVIATLLMIAVAVAMSVIIFMWSQGFLSQTSSATGGQQGSQNQAAQSSISIESGTFVTGTTNPSITMIVRNVGAVAVTMGSVSITGISSNSGFTGSVIATVGTSSITLTASPSAETWTTSTTAASLQNVGKGSAVSIILTGPGSASLTQIKSGDVINIKVTTNVGTFAQSQFTVP